MNSVKLRKLFMVIACSSAIASSACLGQTVYVPGWMRTSEPEDLAWKSFTNVFSSSQCSFRKWRGNELWTIACSNADQEAKDFAAEIISMDESVRTNLTLVGHSLGGRIVARTLAHLSRRGLKIKRGILLAPAIPANADDLKVVGLGSKEPVIVVANPDDVTLKYVYSIAGGEDAPAYGASAALSTPGNVRECPVAKDIAASTSIDAFWGKFDAVKEIANHHACFYFEELSRVLDGAESKGVRVLGPQDKINFEWKVIDAQVWWVVLDSEQNWKLQKNIVTGHCRIIDPSKTRVAWGAEALMRQSFAKVRKQLRINNN